MNIADINKLAGAQGVRVSGKAERVVYTFEYTFPYRQTHTHLSGITLIYPKKSSSKEQQQSCLVRLKYAASYERRDKYDRWASFYMDSVPEAFGLIYVFLMYPDRIRYELVKGKEKRNLTEKEFASLGKKGYGEMSPVLPSLMNSLFKLLVALLELVLAPIEAVFKNGNYMRINNRRKWEYIAVPGEKEYTLIRRYCGGTHKRQTRKEPWMQLEDL